jgi:hypothetical protein
MSLYGRTDSDANKTQVGLTRGNGAGSATETIVFVDDTEAQLSENKGRGINSPGWWAYRTYTDAAGNTRHKSELLAFITGPDANANETQSDDTIAADVASAITIGTQPADQNTSSGAATFSVVATADAGTVTYQWQRKTATGTRWTNVSGATSDSLVLAGQTVSNDGDLYRVKLNSDAGAEEVISDTATLTFVD